MDELKFSGELAFSQPVINIGSDAGNDVVLIGKNIGSFHAMMYFESNQWYIMPLDSSLKVLQNGLPVTDGGAVLQNGAVLTIGDYRLTMNLNGINTDIIAQYQGMSSGPVSDFSAENDSSSGNLILVINGTPPTEIEPGSVVEFELTATNAGPLVANIQMQLQGIPSAWVQIIPPVLNLNEGRKGSFTVRLSPPRDSSAEAGQYYLHFLISSPNYPRETAFVDTAITLLPYSEFLVNGPTPRSITISRNKPTDVSDVVIINNSNSVTDFVVRSYDDSNELNFTFERGTSGIQGQETVRIRPGDNVRVPVSIGAKKLPLFGFTSKNCHYYTAVNPVDRPMDGQSVVGEVVVKPMIRMFWLILILLLLAAAALFIFQPYIFSFQTGSEGKNTQVIMSGSSTGVSWKVSRFASKITVFDGTKETELSRDGSMYFSPTTSTTYTLKSENILSRLLNITHEKSIQVLVIPQRPTIDVLKVDISDALYNQPVTLTWGVGDNATQARVMANKRVTELAKENYSGSQQQGFTEDTLISLKAINDSGYAMKSVFVNVSPDKIDLNRFTVWVRPNGIAVPNDNDTRRTTRWSALQLMLGTEAPTASPLIRPASVNPQPAAQSNVLDIPDNYNSVPSSPGINPEQWALTGGNPNDLASIVRTPMATANAAELLVGPHLNPTATPTPAATVEMGPSVVVAQTAVPQTSPEGTPYNRDFNIKYAEVVEDPLVESGYRVIEYFPDYQLQKGEQILVEWNVNGVNTVKIENLSAEQLNNTGGEFAYPEKSVTYALEAEVGQIKKVYSLPVRVAGDADDGEGSGLNCDLKASATTLNAPGTVMLTWSGGGNNRVQLVSSAKAEADSAEAEKKKEEEAKASGQPYTQPTAGALTGGAIGDWLQPSGFMRVAVEKQTAFMLNAYDGNGNVICTKSVQVNMAGGNDKEDIAASAFRIVKIADDNDVSQKYYAVGQTVHYTIEFTGFPKGKEPTGSVMISDGTSSCSVTLPLTSCSFTAKKAGELTVTAVYSGDNSYKKATATAKETVINKLPTTTMIQSAFKPGAAIAEVITQLQFDEGNEYGLIPSGIITFTIGSGTCDLDIVSEKLTCDGDVETDENDSYKFLIKKLALADPAADRIVAAYKGDDYFLPSTSTPVLFRKVPTTIAITGTETYKTGASLANVVSVLNWDNSIFPDYDPTGTVTYTIGSGTCVLELGTKKLSCESASVDQVDSDGKYEMKIGSMLLADNTADRISAAYSGDSIYNASNSTAVLFRKLDTKTQIYNPIKNENRADLETALTYDLTQAHGLTPTGTITYTIIRPDPNHKETTCVLTLGTNTLSCDGTVNYVNRYQITNMLFEDPESDRVKAVYSGDFFFNRSESPTVIFGEIIEEDIETQLNIDSAKKNPEGPIDLNISLTWDETLAAGAKPGGTIKITSGTGSCTLNLDSSKPTFTDCNADSVTLEDNIYVIKNLQLIGAGESVEAAYSGGGRFLPSTAAAVYFDRVDTTTAIVMAYKTHGNMPTLVTTLSWNTAEAFGEYPLGTITFRIGTDNCVLTLDNDEDAGKVKSFSCEGSDTVVNDGVLATEGENSILTWTIERIALSTGNNADRVKAIYSGDELFNSSSSKEVVFDTVETEIAISDQTKTPSGLVSLNLDLSWYEEPPVEGMRPTGLITLTSGTKNCTLDISKNPAEFTDCESETPELDTSDPKHSVYKITGLRMGTNSGIDIKAVYSGDGTFLTSTSQTKEFNKLDTWIEIDKAYKPDSVSLADVLYHLKWGTEESEGKTPSGTITLTIGSDVCKFDLETKKLTGCIGEETPDPIPWNTVTDGDFVGDFTKLVISSTTADRVKVEYSGDSIFNPSSMIALFKMIPTNISITDAYKVDKDHANVEALLSWDENEAYGRKPTGTIKFVTGSSNCTLEISTGVLSCEPKKGTVSEDHKNYSVLNMLLDNNGVDRISVEYSGDSFFLPSVSSKVLFTTIPTTLVINEADVKSNGLVDLDLTLSWIDTPPAGLTPGKTIRLVAGTDSKSIDTTASTTTETSGSTAGAGSTTDTNQTETQTTGAVCTLTIENSPIFTDCSGEVSVVVNDKSRTYKVTNLKFNSASVGSVKADYSGDGVFLSSTSNLMYFDKINTAITITNAVKSGDLVDLNTLLSWNKEEAEGKLPTGTITLTIGSDSCKLEFDDESAGRVKSFSCTEKDVTTITPALSTVDPNEIITWTMVKVLLSQGSTADRVKVEYSGDSVFNASTSDFILFDISKKDTAIEITDANKSDNKITLTTKLTPAENETGTIVFTSGSATCTIDITDHSDVKFEKCSGTAEYKDDGTIEIKDMVMNGTPGDSIYAEYSGDSSYNKSTSPAFDFPAFEKIDTTLTIETADKTDGKITLTAKLTPEGDETGKVTFTSGSATCTLTIKAHNDVKFEKCSGTAEFKDDGTIEIKDMVMNGTPGDSIYAEYSGDSAYNKSTSPSYSFIKVDTKIAVSKAYKSDSIRAYFNTLLSWDKDEAGDKQPTGTVTFTIGESCKLTIDLEAGNKVKEFSCSDDKTEISLGTDTNGKFDWIFEKVLLTAGSTADRVKAEYSGDENFNPSTSDFILFQTIPTTLDVSEQVKKTGGLVDLTAVLRWDEEPITGADPTGIIKLTMGTATCSLNVVGDAPVFTDCDGKASKASETHRDETAGTFWKKWTFTITDLKVGDGTGDSIKAEYPGDGYYLASASEEKYFNKYDTELDIEKAYKSGTSYADLNTLLTWNKTKAGDKVPTGTITLSIGGDSCKLTFDNPKNGDDISYGHVKDFTCMEKGRTEITPYETPDSAPDTITWEMVNILLSSGSTADRVKAEYSGDANFNPSTSEFVLFESIPTELKITRLFTNEDDPTKLDVSIQLGWTEEPSESGKVPTGTITLTVDDKVCPLMKLSETEPYYDDPSGHCPRVSISAIRKPFGANFWNVSVRGLDMGTISKKTVSAEYTGDSLFQASKYEHKVDTETVINRAHIMPDGTVDLIFTQKWVQNLAGIVRNIRDDKAFRPSGTFKITVGSSSCTLQLNGIDNPTFTDCEVKQAHMEHVGDAPDMYPMFQIYGLKIGDGTASSIKVEYSGDDLFNTSDAEQTFKTRDTELKLDFDQTNKTNDNRVNLVATLGWWAKESSSDQYDSTIPAGPVTFTIGSDSCKLDLTNGSFSCADSSTEVKIFDDSNPPKPVIEEKWNSDRSNCYVTWTLELSNIKLSDSNDPDRVKGDFTGDKHFNPSSSETKYFDKIDTEITIADAYKPVDIRLNFETTLLWDKAKAEGKKATGTITFTIGGDSCKMVFDPSLESENKVRSFSCADGDTKIEWEEKEVTSGDLTTVQYIWTFTNVLLTEGSTADRIKADYSGDGLFNASSSDYVLFDTVPTTTRLLNQEKNPGGLVSALVELSWRKDPKAGDLPKGTIKLTSGSAVCTLDLAASPLRFTDCSGSVRVEPEDMESVDKKLTYKITNLNMGSGIGDDIKAEFSGSGSYLPSASDKKSFSKVDTVLVINNAYKPNDPNYANLLSVLSWNVEKAAERVPTGTIKYTVGGGSCELNLSTKKLSCESAADPISMEKIEVDFNTEGYRVAIEKMLLADSSADRVTAEYSGDAVFNPSTASARLFKKLDTTIDIYNAYRDKTSGRASVYVRIDWDETEDEGLKPTGSLKFNLGSGSCTMDLKTKKLSCVGDTMGTISADGHDYGASNMLLTDADAKIVSVEYSGDGFFNSSVSQQKLFSGLKTTIAITAAGKGCDINNHCFINLSGTLDWDKDESVTTPPTGTMTIKVGNKTIKFDMDYQEKGTDPFTGVKEADEAYKLIANQVGSGYDPTNRHAFEFKNLLLDNINNDDDISIEYNGDDSYAYSTAAGSMDKITINTFITIDKLEEIHYEGGGIAPIGNSYKIEGQLKPLYVLPFDFNFGSDFEFSFTPDNIILLSEDLIMGNNDYKMTIQTNVEITSISITYKGDGGRLYNASNSATKTIQEAPHEMDLTFINFTNKRHTYVDPSGKKHFDLFVGEKRGDTHVTPDYHFEGTWTFVTDSAQCTLKTVRDENRYYKLSVDDIPETMRCKYNTANSYVTTGGSVYIHSLELGSSSDTTIKVYFNGNENYKPASAEGTYEKENVRLSLSSFDLENHQLSLTATLDMIPPYAEIGDGPYYISSYPTGELVIQAGDDYTCTMKIDVNDLSASYENDCGTNEDNHPTLSKFSYRTTINASGLPITNSGVDSIKITYNGDTIYNSAVSDEGSFNRNETKLTLTHTESEPNIIQTTITPLSYNYRDRQLTGRVKYTFEPGGSTCTVVISPSMQVEVEEGSCEGGGNVSDVLYYTSSKILSFNLNKNISRSDTSVSADYSGDGKYSSSKGSTYLWKFNLTLTPESTGLDTSGRLYFNIQPNVNVYYPRFPERYSYFHCQQNPPDTTNCRKLEQKFALSVTVNTDPSAPDLTGSELQFEGPISSDSSSNRCSITPVSSGSGVYSCVLTGIHFTSPGEHKISVRYPGSEHFNEAPAAEFPATFYAVSVSSSDLTETTTIITEPETLTAGTKVLVKAETKSIADPNDKPGEQIHLFYTYNFSTKERVQTCMETASGAGCELTLTNDTDWVYAEFIGYGAYAPSVGSKQVDGASSSSVSLSVGDLEPIGGN